VDKDALPHESKCADTSHSMRSHKTHTYSPY